MFPGIRVDSTELPKLLDTAVNGTDPLASTKAAAQVITWLDLELHMTVSAARANGASWDDIGQALGVSRQAAHKRFGASPRLVPEE